MFFRKGRGLIRQRLQSTVLHVTHMWDSEGSRCQKGSVGEPAFENEEEGTKRSDVHSRTFKPRVWHTVPAFNSSCSENLLKAHYAG